jgi:hypothetical protein
MNCKSVIDDVHRNQLESSFFKNWFLIYIYIYIYQNFAKNSQRKCCSRPFQKSNQVAIYVKTNSETDCKSLVNDLHGNQLQSRLQNSNWRLHRNHTQQFPCHNFFMFALFLLTIAYQGKDIVLRFIIEYINLNGFWLLGNSLFLSEDFWKMTFRLVLKLEIRYRVIIISWRIVVSLRGFLEDYIFAWWNVWVFIILLLP